MMHPPQQQTETTKLRTHLQSHVIPTLECLDLPSSGGLSRTVYAKTAAAVSGLKRENGHAIVLQPSTLEGLCLLVEF